MDNCVFLRLFFLCLFGVSCPLPRQYYFVNMDEQDTFHHISLYATWTEAQIYCRQGYTDLASIRNSDEHQRVSDLAKFVRYVWIGLFLDVWEWSDQGNSSFRYWAVTQPLNLFKSDCVVMVMGIFGKWHDTMCDRQLPFVCYKDGKKQIVRLKVSADGTKDLNSYTERSIILKQIQQKLTGQGMSIFAKLSWRRKSGVFFQPEKNKPVEMSNTRLCDEL
ncbi:hypothetical protein AOLI_G00217050 [Acnodon oligacanthus]